MFELARRVLLPTPPTFGSVYRCLFRTQVVLSNTRYCDAQQQDIAWICPPFSGLRFDYACVCFCLSWKGLEKVWSDGSHALASLFQLTRWTRICLALSSESQVCVISLVCVPSSVLRP